MSIVLPLTAVTLHRCTRPAADPLLTDIRASCYISLYPSLLPRTVAMDTLTVMIPTSPHPGKSVPHQRRLPPFRVALPLERRPTPVIPLNVRLPSVSVILRGLHDLILLRLLIERADVTIEIGIVSAVVGIYKSIPLPLLIRCLLLVPTPPLIGVTVLVLVLLATTAHLNHLQGTLISRFQVGRTLPCGPKINLLRLVPLLVSPSLNLTHLGGTTRGMMGGTPGS
jgi:hypothetical protein